jgi:hypothetical protein
MKGLLETAWYWTVPRSDSRCDSCDEAVDQDPRIAYEHSSATVLCTGCAEDLGVAARCRESRRARKARQLQLVA